MTVTRYRHSIFISKRYFGNCVFWFYHNWKCETNDNTMRISNISFKSFLRGIEALSTKAVKVYSPWLTTYRKCIFNVYDTKNKTILFLTKIKSTEKHWQWSSFAFKMQAQKKIELNVIIELSGSFIEFDPLYGTKTYYLEKNVPNR